jgi:hypothetical protein
MLDLVPFFRKVEHFLWMQEALGHDQLEKHTNSETKQ